MQGGAMEEDEGGGDGLNNMDYTPGVNEISVAFIGGGRRPNGQSSAAPPHYIAGR